MIATGNRHGSAVVTLPSDREILITRQFDAPAALVFKAVTTPALVQRWWACDATEWISCEIDLRVGGRWRYVTRQADGGEFGFHGEYREIDAPTRIVSTEAFEQLAEMFPGTDPDAVASLNTMQLTEDGGVTTLRVTVLHVSPEARDGHVNAGMEGGLQLAFDRLEDIAGHLDGA